MNDNPSNPEAPMDPLLGPGGRRGKIISWLRSNSTIILAVIIIVVIGAGIYAYTRPALPIIPDMGIEEGGEGEIVVTEGEEDEAVEETEDEEQKESVAEEPIISPEPEAIGGPEEETYTKTAQPGEGITHLARRALKSYLEERNNLDLTREHKIYIEDYLQNKTGQELLEIGEARSFSVELIEEAITAAQNLTPEQLKNLEQYSQLVPLL